MADTTIPDKSLVAFLDVLDKGNSRVAERYPGDSAAPPAGAHRLRRRAPVQGRTPRRSSASSRCARSRTYAPDAATFAEAHRPRSAPLAARGLPARRRQADARAGRGFPDRLRGRLRQPPRRRGGRPRAAPPPSEVAAGMAAGTLPPFIGIRIKPLTEELERRSLRTLDLFLTELLEQHRRHAAAELRRHAAQDHGARAGRRRSRRRATRSRTGSTSPTGTLQLELMVETTQSIFAADGRVGAAAPASPRAGGRIVAAHFGTYDYTAACDITAAHQQMRHPACDFAKHVMQVAFAGTGVWLSDGATNIMPVAPHRGAERSRRQQRDNRAAVLARGGCTPTRPALARHRLLPGLGSAPGAAADALRRGLRVLPRRPRRRVGAAEELRRTRPRRRRWSATCSTTRRPGRACSTTSCAAIELRRDHRRRGGRDDRAHARRAARPIVREDSGGAPGLEHDRHRRGQRRERLRRFPQHRHDVGFHMAAADRHARHRADFEVGPVLVGILVVRGRQRDDAGQLAAGRQRQDPEFQRRATAAAPDRGCCCAARRPREAAGQA